MLYSWTVHFDAHWAALADSAGGLSRRVRGGVNTALRSEHSRDTSRGPRSESACAAPVDYGCLNCGGAPACLNTNFPCSVTCSDRREQKTSIANPFSCISFGEFRQVLTTVGRVRRRNVRPFDCPATCADWWASTWAIVKEPFGAKCCPSWAGIRYECSVPRTAPVRHLGLYGVSAVLARFWTGRTESGPGPPGVPGGPDGRGEHGSSDGEVLRPRVPGGRAGPRGRLRRRCRGRRERRRSWVRRVRLSLW